jgi:hypothetical protein
VAADRDDIGCDFRLRWLKRPVSDDARSQFAHRTQPHGTERGGSRQVEPDEKASSDGMAASSGSRHHHALRHQALWLRR